MEAAAALHQEQGHYDEKNKQYSHDLSLCFATDSSTEDYTGGG
jgi:hypothetical protein